MDAPRAFLESRCFRGGQSLEAHGDMLVGGGSRDRIAVAAVGQHVDARTVAEPLTVAGGVGLAVAMRERKLARAHAVVDLATRDQASPLRLYGNPFAVIGAKAREGARVDQQRAIRIIAAPGWIAENLVGVEHA